MKHLTLFLSICWIFWFSQIFAISTICGLSDMPTESVISLGQNVSGLVNEKINNNKEQFSTSVLSSKNVEINSSNSIEEISQKAKNGFIVLPEIKTSEKEDNFLANISQNEFNQDVNDSGSGGSDVISDHIKILEKDNATSINTSSLVNISSAKDSGITSDNNLTTEENPIPVFSEWAQKQMEEAEKRLEKQVTNASYKKNATTGNKPTLVKLRAKNYASPDCGAKIIASNAEAQNTGALLTSSKDEYMLSPCTSRIWFVIELCEAIQLEKVELANFELFSSSPKNFSVAASNRFPTREWSNVGKFIAEDNRNIQSFDLYPHLFGKFLRVDVHSHYNSEHFCPISLFNVYGTSEFEAFETENRPHHDADPDEFDDDFSASDHQISSKTENNLFKSASDAVMSIVKKAAEVLVKTNSNKTENENNINKNDVSNCFTPKINFTCDKCNQSIVTGVNHLLSCKFFQLIEMLKVVSLRNDLLNSNICNKTIQIMLCRACDVECEKYKHDIYSEKNILLNILPIHYIVALCDVADFINFEHSLKTESDNLEYIPIDKIIGIKNNSENKDIESSNDTHEEENFDINKFSKKHTTPKKQKNNLNEDNDKNFEKTVKHKDDSNEVTNISNLPIITEENEVNKIDIDVRTPKNVNIFNLLDKDDLQLTTESNEHNEEIEDKSYTETKLPSTQTEDVVKSKETEMEQGTWDSIEKLLSEQTSSDSIDSNLNINEGGITESQLTQRVQSESIFIRLSNRIKALERNMSLSGQYLEELSRRYKKQVEELQNSFTKTLTAIEEQNRNAIEREQSLTQKNQILEQLINEISIRLNSFITLMAFILAIVILQILISWYFIRSYRRQYLEMVQRYEDSTLVTKRSGKKSKKLNRRKSIETVGHQILPKKKSRRPSEEAMHISGSYKNLLIPEDDNTKEIGNNFTEKGNSNNNNNLKKNSKQRQRKLSVFYGTSSNNRQNLLQINKNSGSNSLELMNSGLQDLQIIPDDEYEKYIPGTDLAYNEFVPKEPLKEETLNDSLASNFKQKKTSKIRKLPSAKFLKVPFTKTERKLVHASTGWDWHRPKKYEINDVKAYMPNINENKMNYISERHIENVNGFNSSSTNSSSVSGLLLGNDGGKGSDESIRMSEVSSITTTNSSILENSNSSKKRSSFRKLLKKVF